MQFLGENFSMKMESYPNYMNKKKELAAPKAPRKIFTHCIPFPKIATPPIRMKVPFNFRPFPFLLDFGQHLPLEAKTKQVEINQGRTLSEHFLIYNSKGNF